MLSQELINILACPNCKGNLEYNAPSETSEESLTCLTCQLKFAVVDGIPNLLIDEAQKL